MATTIPTVDVARALSVILITSIGTQRGQNNNSNAICAITAAKLFMCSIICIFLTEFVAFAFLNLVVVVLWCCHADVGALEWGKVVERWKRGKINTTPRDYFRIFCDFHPDIMTFSI